MIGPIEKITGRAMPMPGNDIDTDRIIPGRFLKCITFDGLGEFAFYDERFNADGKSTGHPVDNPKYKGARIILSGANFGCGSSREHAPQAIKRAGYDVVIAESYAEIFFGNSTTLGIACIVMTHEQIAELISIVEAKPEAEFAIDIQAKTVTAEGKSFPFDLKDGARTALLAGTYDSLGTLLKNIDKVKAFEAQLPYSFSR